MTTTRSRHEMIVFKHPFRILVPRNWRGLTTPAMRGAIRCGENSLAIYCLGVLLALASNIALLSISNVLAMQIALSLAGILAMITPHRY